MVKVLSYTQGMSNGFFLVGEGGTVAVDCGSLLGVGLYIEALRECGVNPTDVKLLLVTHGHLDHFTNMGAARAVTGAPIMCHRYAAESLRRGLRPQIHARSMLGWNLLYGSRVPKDIPPEYVPCMEPDLIFEGTLDLHSYGVDAYCIETPGHSAGSISIITAEGDALVGDVLVDDFTGKATLAYFGQSEDRAVSNALLFESCEKLLNAGVKTIYSGHGGPFTRKDLENALAAAREEANTPFPKKA